MDTLSFLSKYYWLEKMDEINQALSSSISYSGGNKLIDIRKSEYIVLK